MIDGATDRTAVLVYMDMATKNALARMAAANERTMSAQLRYLVRSATGELAAPVATLAEGAENDKRSS